MPDPVPAPCRHERERASGFEQNQIVRCKLSQPGYIVGKIQHVSACGRRVWLGVIPIEAPLPYMVGRLMHFEDWACEIVEGRDVR